MANPTANDGKLNERMRHELDEYLIDKQKLIAFSNPTTTEVIQWVMEALKFVVTTSMITSRVGPEGRLYIHQWPGTEISKKGRATSKQVLNTLLELVAAQNAWMAHAYAVMVPLGFVLKPVPSAATLKPLLEQAAEELADTDFREDEEK
jgi:hypothetical protein